MSSKVQGFPRAIFIPCGNPAVGLGEGDSWAVGVGGASVSLGDATGVGVFVGADAVGVRGGGGSGSVSSGGAGMGGAQLASRGSSCTIAARIILRAFLRNAGSKS